MAEPELRLETEKFRIVRVGDENVFEKREGLDAMGVPRWRELRFADADNVARMLRDFILSRLDGWTREEEL